MGAYVTSPELQIVLHFPEDSADAVRDWLGAAMSKGITVWTTNPAGASLLLNLQNIRSAVVSEYRPDRLTRMDIWLFRLLDVWPLVFDQPPI
ncbi:MAG: hypothetical protein JO147_09710 [Actinobacteria bacterium]|nr:hypothetical protein [Actinomycetota bacterium]